MDEHGSTEVYFYLPNSSQTSYQKQDWGKVKYAQSVDDHFLVKRSNIHTFLEGTLDLPRKPIIRSNSYTLQDLDRQRKTIQAYFDGGFDINDDFNDNKYYHQYDVKGRRLSKSLPELTKIRTHFDTGRNNTILESEYDEDEIDDVNYVSTDSQINPTWSNKYDYILTVIGHSFGLNNIWRFPYFCFINHAGSFLLSYTILMFLCGLPLLCMEYAVGQLTHKSHIAFAKICPIFKGIVFSACIAASLLIPLYASVNCWSMLYFFKSYRPVLPWSVCSNFWNDEFCITKTKGSLTFNEHLNSTTNETAFDYDNSNITNVYSNTAFSSASRFASQQFFDLRVLNIDLNTSSLGIIKWDLSLILIVLWLVTFVASRKNITFSANATFFLAIIPPMAIGLLFLQSLFLEGAKNGLIYFFSPTWEGITEEKVWLYAAGLCFHSLGNTTGLSVTMAKCNRDRNNLMKDSVIVVCINMLAILIIGSIIFSTIGYLSYTRDIDISKVVIGEPGLGFVVFSELLSTLPMKTLWSCIFFKLLFCLGTDYQKCILTTLVTCINEAQQLSLKKKLFSHQILVLILSIIFFLVSLLFITQKGILLVFTIDYYIAVWLTVILATCEIVLIGWFYGAKNLIKTIKLSTSRAPGIIFLYSWYFTTPCFLGTILLLNLTNLYQAKLEFRNTNDVFLLKFVGPLLIFIALIAIPTFAFFELNKKSDLSFLSHLKLACKPKIDLMNDLKTGLILANKAVFPSDDETSNHPKTQQENINQNNLSDHLTLSIMEGLNRETIV